ncbi:unnamed protein product [Adineta steineri]|uniref:Uncharacterized protein n=1 Tax=Adineta steineri TaxID=433720 RepID=A0A818WNN7_9BILA|nr:unnamed protein product [Adineta steineri]CAF3728224.1 unnamed protein product [Adineta steineri]
MFGLLAALNSLPQQREGREALNFENYIRTGQGLPSTKIYYESLVDKRARQELGRIRYKERIYQQIKLIRLMKKLLIKIEHETCDEELEQMHRKITQLEIKVEKSAHAKNINCEDMFNMDKPDDPYDMELERIIRNTITENIDPTIDNRASGDNKCHKNDFFLNNEEKFK